MDVKDPKIAGLLDSVLYCPTDTPIFFNGFLTAKICVGHYETERGVPFPSCCHSHESYEFIIPHTPLRYLFRGEQLYFGQVGRVYPIPSGEKHGIRFPQEDVRVDVISIEKDFFEQVKRDKNCTHLKVDSVFTCSPALRNLLEMFKNECKKQVRDEKHKLSPLASLIASELLDLSADSKELKEHSSSSYQQGVPSVADYINEHYMDDLDIETLAAIAGLSPSYFTRCFAKAFSYSPRRMEDTSVARTIRRSTRYTANTLGCRRIAARRSRAGLGTFGRCFIVVAIPFPVVFLDYSIVFPKRQRKTGGRVKARRSPGI